MTALISQSAGTSSELPQQIVSTLKSVLGDGPAALHEPRFNGNELQYVQECIESTFVSSVGKFVDRFEAELAAYLGAKHAVATVNGTSGLHVALLLAGVERGDEVIVPALTFVATANAVHYCGGIPHFVDSEETTFGLDPLALREWLNGTTDRNGETLINRATGRRIRAIVPMHTFGHPCDIEGLLHVAAEFGLVVVEDAAESLGSTFRGKHAGTFGQLGVLSFNGNKIITTGGGGAILTNDSELARRAKHLTTTARVSAGWFFNHDEVGFNYRMPNLNAALGCAQLESLPDFLESKRRLFRLLKAAFDGLPHLHLQSAPPRCRSNYWLQTLILDDSVADQRDAILTLCNSEGIMTRPTWTLMHKLPAYQECPHAPLPVAEALERRLINIPSSAGLA